MTAEHLALVVAGGHMDMGVKLAVHGVYAARERDYFERALKLIGVVPLLGCVEYADGKIIGRAQRGDGGELDILLERKLTNFVENFLAAVDAHDYFVAESLVLHLRHFPFFLLPGLAFFFALGFAQPFA